MAAKRTSDTSRGEGCEKKRKMFRFVDEMVENLISCLLEYKVKCEYGNIDFNADKISQYKCIRVEMAKLYNENDDIELFGPPFPTILPEHPNDEEKGLLKEEKKIINRGYQRILEKIKDLRQGFSKAIINGTRSGSGKVIYEHFDKLKQIWGACPNTQPLPTGIDSDIVNSSVTDGHISETQQQSGGDSFSFLNTAYDSESLGCMSENQTLGDSEKGNANGNKSFSDNISKLVDEKRKHLERRLSASQRDELLLKEAKEDRLERKELRDMLKLSNDSLANAMNNMSQSMMQISNSLAKSMEMIASSSVTSPYPAFPRRQIRHTSQQGQQSTDNIFPSGYYANLMSDHD